MPVPFILIAVAIGAAVGVGACASSKIETKHDAGTDKPEDAGGGDGPLPDDAGTADAPEDAAIVTPGDGAADGDASTSDGGVAEDATVPGDAFVQQDATPATPFPPGTSRVGDAPCAFPASLSYDAANNRLLMTCGGATNALYRSSALPAGGAWTRVGTVGGYPSHHLQLSDRYTVVGHAMPDGATILDHQTGLASDTILFSSIAFKDPAGQPLSFTPNNPAGAVLAGGKLCIAASNLDHIDMDPSLTTFFPGTFLCLPYLGNGTVDKTSAVAHPTSGVNPTGMALIDAQPLGDGTQRFAVLSSGPGVPDATRRAALEVVTTPSMTAAATDLGAISAQIAPTMALTDGGLLLVGVQKPSNRLLGIDHATGTIDVDREMPLVQNFIASIAAQGNMAALSDFGVFGEGGSVLFVNASHDGWTGVPVTPLLGQGGPLAIGGTTLYQAVTSKDGMSGSVWSMNLSNMQ